MGGDSTVDFGGPNCGGGLVAQLCTTVCDLWTVAHQASLVHGISKARILFPSPGDLLDPGMKLECSALQGNSLHLSHRPL